MSFPAPHHNHANCTAELLSRAERTCERRGSRLKHDEDLFTGLFWTGKRGLELGLVDRLGDLRGTLRERYGETVRIRLIGEPRGLTIRRGGSDGVSLPAGLAAEALATLEARALWARYGL